MANQNQNQNQISPSYRPLDPNASPYLKLPRFYVYVSPHPHPHPHPLPLPLPQLYNSGFLPFQFYCTYNQPKSSPNSVPKPRKISFSLTPVPSGPRCFPKPRRCPEKKAMITSRFEGQRWKNKRKQYEQTLPLDANTTSLMIKNIPNRYTRELLIQTLDAHCQVQNKNGGHKSAYDFVYLPIDFNRRSNAGFAFVNFTTPEAALLFRDALNGKRWNRFDSSKVAEISRARIQGKEALIKNCKDMDFSYGCEEDMPVVFEPAREGCHQVRSRMYTVGKYVK